MPEPPTRGIATPGLTTASQALDAVPRYAEVTVVCAHPDDESFGLGGLVHAFLDHGARLRLVCFTSGEASTLGACPDLAVRRAAELRCAAKELGIDAVGLLPYPDGALPSVPLEELAAEIVAAGPEVDALLTFDHGGITGHPDHQHATSAAVAAAHHLGIPAWGWAIPEWIAAVLRAEFGAPFVGRDAADPDLTVPVDRIQQRRAIGCHGTQLLDNTVPHRRIELSGDTEALRLLHDPTRAPVPSTPQREENPT